MILVTSVALGLMMTQDGAPTATGAIELSFETRETRGQVVVALFTTEQNWQKNQNPVRTLRVTPGQSLRVNDLVPGRYGIMAFQDKNGDGKLNTLPIGLPTEPYGFSNNARGRFGPPNWAQAGFEVRNTTVSQTIRLR